MAKISYIVSIYNKSKYLKDFFESLSNLKGSFRKEFILINDASTDDSLNKMREYSKELPNSILISHSTGPELTLNDGLYLAQGDYIQFLEADTILDPNNTIDLLESLLKFGAQLAYGATGSYNPTTKKLSKAKIKSETQIITNPLSDLFSGKNSTISQVGSSSTIISRDVLSNAFNINENIYSNDLSIALRCANYSDFVFCSKTVSYKTIIDDKNLYLQREINDTVNHIRAVRNFIDYDPDSSERFKKEIYKFVVSNIYKLNNRSLTSISSYLKSKIYVPKISLENLKTFIDNKIEILSKKI